MRLWIIWIIILILLVLIWKYGYDYYKYEVNVSIEERENRKIDEYNFGELGKVKQILDNIWKNDKKFFTFKEFNEIYSTNIKPIKNCYYVSNSNWSENYIFWFRLESEKYINKYWNQNYAYPKYDLPYDTVCFGLWEWGCSNFILDRFIYTISNPCED